MYEADITDQEEKQTNDFQAGRSCVEGSRVREVDHMEKIKKENKVW